MRDARRTELALDRHVVADVLSRGNARANELADDTIRRVRELMGMLL